MGGSQEGHPQSGGMKLHVLDSAKDDLVGGYHFYEEQSPGLGSYFLDSLFSEIDSLGRVYTN